VVKNNNSFISNFEFMKFFMLRTALFVLPFMAIHGLNIFAYDQNEGDLARVSYLYKNACPKSIVAAPYKLNEAFTLASSLEVNEHAGFDVMTIGDSFSEQDSLGYKNFMAHQGVSVLHMDGYLTNENPVQMLVELINGGFFDHIQVGTVVLESVERLFVQRCENIDFSRAMAMDSLFSMMTVSRKVRPKQHVRFFSDAMIKIPWTNLEYLYLDKPRYTEVYKVSITSDGLFTNGPRDLLFAEIDVRDMAIKNDSSKIVECNKNLEIIRQMLSKRKMKLVVMVCPDKYDLYYPYIVEKGELGEPRFFSYFNSLPKTYTYLNVFDSLSVKLPFVKDVYYYDDTHWSPATAKWVGGELVKMVKSN